MKTDTQSHLPALTDEQLEALRAFAEENGRSWKTKLSDVYWYNARIWMGGKPNDGYLLHGLRNSHGPDWLFGKHNPLAKA